MNYWVSLANELYWKIGLQQSQGTSVTRYHNQQSSDHATRLGLGLGCVAVVALGPLPLNHADLDPDVKNISLTRDGLRTLLLYALNFLCLLFVLELSSTTIQMRLSH
jgi:hypothetical protein